MRRLFWSLSIVAMTATPLAAQDFDPAAALRGFLTDKDRLGADTATIGAVTADGDTLTANDVALRWAGSFTAPDGKAVTLAATMDIPSLSVTGLAESDDGGHTAAAIAVPSARLEFTATGADVPVRYTVNVDNYAMKDASWGAFPTVAADADHPVSRFAPLVDWAISQSYENASVDEIALDTLIDKDTQKLSYGPVSIGPVANGRIETLEYPPFEVRQQAELPTPEGEAEMVDILIQYGKIFAEGIDMQPLAQLLTGNGDATGPMPVVARQTLGETTATIGDKATIVFGGIDLQDATVDPTRGPLLEKLDPIVINALAKTEPDPLVLAGLFIDAYGAFGVGHYSFDNIAVTSPDFSGKLASFAVDGVDSSGLKRFAIEGGTVEGSNGTGNLDLVELRDLAFPPREAVLERVRNAMAGLSFGPADLASLPKLGGFTIKGFRAVPAPARGAPPIALDLADLSLTEYVGPVPRKVTFAMRGLELPLAFVQHQMAQMILAGLGVNPVKADASLSLSYVEEDQSFALDESVSIEKVGEVTAEAALTGIPPEFFQNPLQGQYAMESAALQGFSFDFTDGGIVSFVVGMMSEQAGVSAAEFAEGIASQIAMMVAIKTGDQQLAQELAETLRAFLDDPKSLFVRAAPESPVEISEIMKAAQQAPKTIPDILNLSITANQ